jgi:hypothetical protein
MSEWRMRLRWLVWRVRGGPWSYRQWRSKVYELEMAEAGQRWGEWTPAGGIDGFEVRARHLIQEQPDPVRIARLRAELALGTENKDGD